MISDAADLPLGLWRLHVRGPRAIRRALHAVLSSVAIPEAGLPPLEVAIAPEGRAAGRIDGDEVWSIELPKRGWLAPLVGQIVGTATSVLRGLLFIHAAAVELRGRGYVLVGGPGVGKTSVAAVLVRSGAGYLSDEIALLDPQHGSLHPFALPLAVKPWTAKAIGALPPSRRVASEGGVTYLLPSRIAQEAIPLDSMILLDPALGSAGRPGAGSVEIPRAEMLLTLSRHASSFRYRPQLESAFSGFVRLLRTARCRQVGAAVPADAAAAIGSLSALCHRFRQ
jgi:hypothetical protein